MQIMPRNTAADEFGDDHGYDAEYLAAQAQDFDKWEEDARQEQEACSNSQRTEDDEEPRHEPRDVFAIATTTAPTPISDRHVPGVIWAYAKDHAYRVGTSAEPVALSCIVVAATAIRHGWKIQPKTLDDGWTEPAIIWGAVTGTTGANKSSSMDGSVGVLSELQKQWLKEDAAAQRQHELDMEVYTAGRRAWVANQFSAKPNPNAPVVCPDEPERVPTRRLLASDATVEALIPICADNPSGILVMNDELMGWFASFGAYKSSSGGASKDKNAFIKAFGGRHHDNDRSGSGYRFAEVFALSILGSIQDDVLRKDISKYPADGLMARFLFAQAEVCVGHNVKANKPAFDAVRDMIERLATGGPGRTLQFAPEAEPLRDSLHRYRIEAGRNPSICAPVREHLAKWDALFPRLALVFELMVNADPQEVSLESAELADRYLREVILPEQFRVYDAVMGETQEMIDARAIAGHVLDQRLGMVLFSEVSAKVSGLRGKNERILAAMDLLVEYGWLTPRQTRNRKGQRKPGVSRWEVTPSVHGIVWKRGQK